MGIRKPKLGTSSKASNGGLAAALFTATQRRVLTLLFGQPERCFGKSELIELAGGGSGAIQREVARLVDSGLVHEVQREHRKWLQANPSAPIFAELCAIVDKTTGIAAQVGATLAPLAPHIRFATLYGSVAKASDRADSDVDLLVVSDTLHLEELYRALSALERRLGRSISPTIYSSVEFETRRRDKNPFLTKVLAGKHTVLIGRVDGVQAA